MDISRGEQYFNQYERYENIWEISNFFNSRDIIESSIGKVISRIQG